MADFGNIQTPNFATAALGGYAAGQAVGKQRRRDDALALYGTDPERGIEALATVDPALSEQLRANADAARLKAAYAKVYTPQQALGAPQPQASMTPPQGDMTSPQMPVTPPQPAPQMAGGLPVNMAALQELASIGPEGAKGAQAILGLIETGDKQRVEKFKAHAEVKGQLALYLKSLPPAQRAAAFQAAMPELLARGFVPEASANMNFDDAALDRDVALAVPTVQALTQRRADQEAAARAADRDADNRRADEGMGIRREALEFSKSRARGAGGNTLAAPDIGGLSDAALMAIAAGSN